MTNKRIIKKDLVNKIHSKYLFIEKDAINDSINIICDFLMEELIENKAISISNFGTFSPGIHKGHIGKDLCTHQKVIFQDAQTVRFRPNISFMRLLRVRRANFLKK